MCTVKESLLSDGRQDPAEADKCCSEGSTDYTKDILGPYPQRHNRTAELKESSLLFLFHLNIWNVAGS